MTKPLEITRKWPGLATGRACGDCAACCTWLGIDELKKWTGQACKHLDGRDPTKRCTIYESRPKACSGYRCMWLEGWGPDELRPENSGLIITAYRRNDGTGIAVTVLIFDYKRAPHLHNAVVLELLAMGVDEVRLINYWTKKGILCSQGQMIDCQLLKPTTYEELVFRTVGKPIATYAIKEEDDEDVTG